ncbi:organic cation/carnitine transporter 2-like [Nelusetta ayraudi]|uniref:organic cation/carnitine transporter 2-like n=1 Tax=Nelusetta ayraudi TaxID=303726 RepID=UPI003F70C9AD
MQDYDEAVSFLGTWGPFQKRLMLLLSLGGIPGGYNLLCNIFLLATPSHHCRIPAHSNLSQEWIQASIPVQVDGQPERSSCSRYELSLVQNLSASGLQLPIGNLSVLESYGLKQESCEDGWIYSTEYYRSTVVTEFNLVCDNEWKKPLTSLVYFLGGLCGCLLSGPISDRFGRKSVFFGGSAMLSISTAALAFAPSWPVFLALFFLAGINQIPSYLSGFVLGSEILTGFPRVLFTNVGLNYAYVLGAILLPTTGYFVREWRYLSLFLAVPGLAYLPFWWLVPESPRWLASHGRLREAEAVVRAAARMNGVTAPDVIFLSASVKKEPVQKEKSHGFLDMLRTRNIRNVSLILWLVWFSVSVSYFGMQFNTSGLSGNPYLNYIMLSAVELIAYTCSWVAARGFPRRWSYIGFNLLGALAILLIQITVSFKTHPLVTLTLVMLGRFGVLAGNALLYVFTSELSPTVIRNTMMSSSATFSRLGSSISPYLLQLAVFSPFLPWIIVGCLSLLSALLCFLLPETFKKPMLDSIQQMEPIRCFKCPWGAKPLPKDDGKLATQDDNAPEVICTTHL